MPHFAVSLAAAVLSRTSRSSILYFRSVPCLPSAFHFLDSLDGLLERHVPRTFVRVLVALAPESHLLEILGHASFQEFWLGVVETFHVVRDGSFHGGTVRGCGSDGSGQEQDSTHESCRQCESTHGDSFLLVGAEGAFRSGWYCSPVRRGCAGNELCP